MFLDLDGFFIWGLVVTASMCSVSLFCELNVNLINLLLPWRWYIWRNIFTIWLLPLDTSEWTSGYYQSMDWTWFRPSSNLLTLPINRKWFLLNFVRILQIILGCASFTVPLLVHWQHQFPTEQESQLTLRNLIRTTILQIICSLFPFEYS